MLWCFGGGWIGVGDWLLVVVVDIVDFGFDLFWCVCWLCVLLVIYVLFFCC